jgi:transcriptional regulator with XRE-family HTH domain
MTVGERIKKLRGKSMSQYELAKAVGLSRNTIYSYENGRRLPDAGAIIALANFFNVTTDYLLGRSDVQMPSMEVQSICIETGLSEKAVLALRSLLRVGGDRLDILDTCSLLIEQETSTPDYSNYMISEDDNGSLEHIGGFDYTAHSMAMKEWHDEGYVPVISALSKYLALKPKRDVVHAMLTDGRVLPEKEARNIKDAKIIGCFPAGEPIKPTLLKNLYNLIDRLKSKRDSRKDDNHDGNSNTTSE